VEKNWMVELGLGMAVRKMVPGVGHALTSSILLLDAFGFHAFLGGQN
jgi:hypothetical protein